MIARQNVSLRHLLLVLSIGAVLLTASLLLAMFFFFERSSIENSLLEVNIAYARKLADTTDHFFSSARQQLRYSADHLNNLNNSELLQIEAQRLWQQGDFFNSVIIVNDHAQVLASAPQEMNLTGVYLTSEVSKKSISSHKSFISQPFISAMGNYSIFISQPIFDSYGKYLGYLGGTLYLKKKNILSEILSENFYNEGPHVSIVNDDGKIIFDHNPDLVGTSIEIGDDLKEKLHQSATGKYLLQNSGNDYLLGYSSLHETEWNVFIYGTTEIVKKMMIQFIRTTVWYVGFIIIVIGVAVAVLASYISAPLEKLAKLTQDQLIDFEGGSLPEVKAWYREVRNLQQAVHHYMLRTLDKMTTLKNDAMKDPLTNLFNRRGFLLFSKHYEHLKNNSLISIDIDHFKRVNDSWGHDVGDVILQRVADIIKACSRNNDIVCRFGGEEFIVFLPATSLTEAMLIAERLRNSIARSVFPCIGNVTVSVGVVNMESSKDINAALIQVDKALYAAKASGRNIVMVDDGKTLQPVGLIDLKVV